MATDDGVIEFSCDEELYGEIPEPKPASKYIPEWYENLGKWSGGLSNELTVKACMSFLDAMTSGWIVPFTSDIRVEADEELNRVEFSLLDGPMGVSNNLPEQLGGDSHPGMMAPIVKFNTPWFVETPEGVSALFTQPFNRYEDRFTCFTGIIDTDNVKIEANIPAIWHKRDYDGIISCLEPMVQIIPYSRDGIVTDGVIRSNSSDEMKELDEDKERRTTGVGVYKNEYWEPKRGSRIIERE